jgi:signal transduction histidine kinase
MGPEGRVIEAPVDPIVDLPTRWLDTAVAVVWGLALAGVAALGVGGAGLAEVAGSLVLLVVVWFALRRRALNGGRGWPVVLGALLLVCLTGTAQTPAFATFQALAYPLAWLLTPGLRSALAANVAVALAIGVGYAANTSLLETAAVLGVSLAFSFALGGWITRITERSAGRQVLIERLTAAQEQLAVLHRDAGALSERERLSRELHDTLTQSLTGIVMLTERARSRHPEDAGLAALEDAGRQALREARAIVTATAPVPLDGGLRGALDTLAGRFSRETGLTVAVDVEAEVPRELEVVLLRCAQEGLANVRKHAAARAVSLRVAVECGRAVLTVTDDGTGPRGGSGFGIAGMRDRLALVAGDVALGAVPTGGSELTVRVPVAQATT